MKLSLTFSITLHVVVLGLFFASKAMPRKFEGYPTVVPVELVQLKPVSFEAPEVQRAEPAKVTPPAQPQPKKLEGVTIEKPKKEEVKEEVVKETPVSKPEPKKEAPPKEPDQGKSTVASEKVRLDAEEFPFSYYLALLQSRIQANWEPPFDGGRGALSKKVVIFFKIQRSGRVTDVAVEGSSGDYLFDQAAIRAVSLSNPLAPLPTDFPKAFLGVHFEFEQGM